MSNKKTYFDISILIFIGLGYFLSVKLMQYYNFGLHNDFYIYENILYNSVHGKFFYMRDIAFDCNFFSLHGTYIILLLIPLYWLIQSPFLLLFLHALGLSLAVIPLYLLTIKILNSRISAVLISLSFIFSRVVNYGLGYDVHPEVWYPLFFLFVFLKFEDKNWAGFFIFMLLALMIKEDSYLVLACFGLYILYRKNYRIGLSTVIISAVMFCITFFVVFPSFNETHDYKMLHYWSDYGSTQGEIFKNFLNPVKHFNVIFTAEKIPNIFNMLSVYIFLPVIAWPTLVFLVLPGSLILFSSSEPTMFNILVYHGMLITPFLYYASLLNIKYLKEKFPSRAKILMLVLVILIFTVNLANSRIFKQIFENEFTIQPRYKTVEKMIEIIPPDVLVSVQVDIAPHIKPSDGRYIIPRNVEKSAYLLFDLNGNSYPLSKEENLKIYNECKSSGNWEILNEADGFALFKKK